MYTYVYIHTYIHIYIYVYLFSLSMYEPYYLASILMLPILEAPIFGRLSRVTDEIVDDIDPSSANVDCIAMTARSWGM